MYTYFVRIILPVFILTDANGLPWSAATIQVTGDTITDLHEDMAAEQKARTTYDNILRFCDDPDVKDPIRFLREREIVHYQRFGEAKRGTERSFKFFLERFSLHKKPVIPRYSVGLLALESSILLAYCRLWVQASSSSCKA